MPFRQRERFERTDVPRYSPYRNAVAIGVLVAVGVLLVVLLSTLWAKAQKPISVGNESLSKSTQAQGQVTSPDGYTVSQDSFTNVLVLTVDDVNAKSPKLTKAQILSLDATARKGTLVTIPLDTKVNDGKADVRLQDLYSGSGASACIVPLATAANLRMTHAMLASDDVWDKIESYKGAGVSALLSHGADLLYSINTDMSTGDLMDVAELVQSIGVNNLKRMDAPASQEADGAGGNWSVLNSAQLGADIGIMVPAA